MGGTVVLLSGGLDSTVNLAMALDEGEDCLGLTFDYGQTAAQQETRASLSVCNHYGVQLETVDLSWLGRFWEGKAGRHPGSYIKGDNGTATPDWVPNRNAMFVNLAGSVAEGLDREKVLIGLNREEARVFPDNSREFLEAANGLLAVSTLSGVSVSSYTVDMDKEEIGMVAGRLRIPWKRIWSCYCGGDVMCGQCRSCRLLLKAAKAGNAQGELRGEFSG